MVYQSKFVVAIKDINDNVLRENGDVVYLPFGSEYKIYLKNLETRKCRVKIEIDGQDALNGSLILDSKQAVNLERFIRDLDQGNRFKFIERTAEVEEYRGVGAEDGLIRIEYQFEMAPPVITVNPIPWVPHDPCPWRKKGPYWEDLPLTYNNTIGGRGMSSGVPVPCASTPTATFTSNYVGEVKGNEEGITVPGSISHQRFRRGYIGCLESQSYTIVLKLKGITDTGVHLERPVTVKNKVQCVTCGTKSRNDMKFCSRCGTSLEII